MHRGEFELMIRYGEVDYIHVHIEHQCHHRSFRTRSR